MHVRLILFYMVIVGLLMLFQVAGCGALYMPVGMFLFAPAGQLWIQVSELNLWMFPCET